MSLEKMSPKNKKVEEVSGSEKKPSEKIDQLKQEINSLNKEFSQAHGSRHDDLEEKMIAKEKEIKKIEGKEKIDQLKKEINSLNKEFSQAHGSSHDDLEEKMIAKENKIREIERGLKKGGEVDEGKIDNEKNTEDNIKNLEEKIDILEQQLENLQKRHESVSGTEKEDLEKTIIEKEEKIKGLKDQLESFQEKIKKEKEKKDESNFDKAGPEKGSEEEKGDAKDENVEKGELGPSKEDLDLLNKAREGLVEAEAAKKKYEGIMGKLKGFLDKDEKAEVVKEYEDALEEYQNAKYEYMDDIADEKIKIMDMRIKEFSEKRGWLLKIKKAYEKLGKWNLSNLLGDKWKEKVKSNKDDSFFKKALKFGARFGTQTLSVRFLISASLIGAGTVSGLGITAATGVLAARRLLVGLGTGLGGYDLLSMFGDKKALKKASENVTDDSLKDMDVNEITKRMAAFEQQAENSGSDEILKDPIYQKLSDRLGEKFNKIKEAEKKEKSIADKMDALIKSTDENLDQKRLEHDKKNIKRKVVGTCIGMFFAGGLLNRIVGSFIGDDVPETSNGEVVSGGGDKTSNFSFKPGEADYEARRFNVEQVYEKMPFIEAGEAAEFLGGDVNFQGGDSIWEEIENQFAERMDTFDNFSEAEKTYLVDHVKDEIVESPENFGLDNVEDLDKLNTEQLKDIKWNELFKRDQLKDFIEKTTKLTEAQKTNILENNEILNEWYNKTNLPIDSEYNHLIIGEDSPIKQAGGVEKFFDNLAPEEAKVLRPSGYTPGIEVDAAAENTKLSEALKVFQNSDLDPNKKINSLKDFIGDNNAVRTDSYEFMVVDDNVYYADLNNNDGFFELTEDNIDKFNEAANEVGGAEAIETGQEPRGAKEVGENVGGGEVAEGRLKKALNNFQDSKLSPNQRINSIKDFIESNNVETLRTGSYEFRVVNNNVYYSPLNNDTQHIEILTEDNIDKFNEAANEVGGAEAIETGQEPRGAKEVGENVGGGEVADDFPELDKGEIDITSEKGRSMGRIKFTRGSAGNPGISAFSNVRLPDLNPSDYLNTDLPTEQAKEEVYQLTAQMKLFDAFKSGNHSDTAKKMFKNLLLKTYNKANEDLDGILKPFDEWLDSVSNNK